MPVRALGLIIVALGVFWINSINEEKDNVRNLIRLWPFSFTGKEELDALNANLRMLNEQMIVAQVTVILGIAAASIGLLIYVNSPKGESH